MDDDAAFEEFRRRSEDSSWTFGVEDGLYAIRHVLGKGWLIWYWTATVLFIALLSAGLVWLATVDGWHHLVWIPYVAYMTLYARPNMSLIDVIWSFIVAVPFAVVASLLAWRVDFAPAMAGIPCLVWGGSRLFYYAERIRRRLASDPVLFKAMSDTDMIIWMKTG